MTVVVLEAGRRFYESREHGVGDYSVESLLSDLESLVLHGGIHSRNFGFHRMLSKRFPFGIYYETDSDSAFVFAILDMRRDPVWLRAELEKRTKTTLFN